MRKRSYLIPFLTVLCFANVTAQNDFSVSKDWNEITRVYQKIDNVTYHFPNDVSAARRNAAIDECRNSITENLELIMEKAFVNDMDVEFLHSRDEMKKFTGMGAQGMAFPDRNTLFSLLKDEGSPIKHEMMHMITMYKWGTPPNTSTWMNEGLATYAGGTCSNYTLAEIYKYLIQSGKAISMNQLADNFYANPEMVGYTQSAFVCKYLIDLYGMEKFKLLWKNGYQELHNIYGFNTTQLETKLLEFVNEKHPIEIAFNWEKFEKGC